MIPMTLAGLVAYAVASAPARRLERFRRELSAEIEEARPQSPVMRDARSPSRPAEIYAAIDSALSHIDERSASERDAWQRIYFWPGPDLRPELRPALDALAADLAP